MDVDPLKYYLKSITETKSDAIIASDESGLIRFWNIGAYNILGYQSSEVLDKPITIIIPKRYHDSHNAGIKRLSTGGNPHVLGRAIEVHAIHKDGKEFPIELTLGMSTYEGKYFFSAIIRDITKRHDAERKIKEQLGKITSLKGIIEKYTPKILWKSAAGALTSDLSELPSERLRMTFLFCDTKDFTYFNESEDPEKVIQVINSYFADAVEIVRIHGGEIEQFMGDAFFASFKDAYGAILVAIKITKKFRQIDSEKRKLNKRLLQFRISLHEGDVVRGNIGSDYRKDYTLIGSAVNIASRLEAVCKPGHILISEELYSQFKNTLMVTSPLDFTLKGIENPVRARYLKGAKLIQQKKSV